MKEFDEPDSINNYMKLVWRINNRSGELPLRQTRRQLQLDSNNIEVGNINMEVSKVQASSYTDSINTSEILHANTDILGWGQVYKTHRADVVRIDAAVKANSFIVVDDEGRETVLNNSGGGGSIVGVSGWSDNLLSAELNPYRYWCYQTKTID